MRHPLHPIRPIRAPRRPRIAARNTSSNSYTRSKSCSLSVGWLASRPTSISVNTMRPGPPWLHTQCRGRSARAAELLPREIAAAQASSSRSGAGAPGAALGVLEGRQHEQVTALVVAVVLRPMRWNASSSVRSRSRPRLRLSEGRARTATGRNGAARAARARAPRRSSPPLDLEQLFHFVGTSTMSLWLRAGTSTS